MNRELLLKIADQIELEPRSFDLSRWENQAVCGTTRCVAGWAIHIADPMFDIKGSWPHETVAAAMDALDITPEQAKRLFYGKAGTVWMDHAERYGWDVDRGEIEDWSDVEGHQAAKVLRQIADGEIEL